MHTPRFPYGTVTREADGTYSVVYERSLHHPIARVWQTITDPALVAAWIGELKIELAVGGDYYLRFPSPVPGEENIAMGKVTEVAIPHLLAYWYQIGNAPRWTNRWELTETPDGTLLRFTVEGIPDGPDFAATGWHTTLDVFADVAAGLRTEYFFSEEAFWQLHEHYGKLGL